MVTFLTGNVLDVLKTLPSESVHCIVTSPPYFGLRDYGTTPQIWLNGKEPCKKHKWGTRKFKMHNGRGDSQKGAKFSEQESVPDIAVKDAICSTCGAWRGELGLEPNLDMYVNHLVQVFREAKRVLRSDGTFWLNIADSYSTAHPSGETDNKRGYSSKTGIGGRQLEHGRANGGNLPEKNLMGIPWRTAFALQADGWILRSDIIWAKPNPMPESVTDRCTKSHEYIFMFAKSPRYYYDAYAVAEQAKVGYKSSDFIPNSEKDKADTSEMKTSATGASSSGRDDELRTTRNKRDVWTINTKPFRGAHFATWPPELVETMILSATSAKGVCLNCGAGYVRVIEKGKPLEAWKKASGADSNGEYLGEATKDFESSGAQNASEVKARILEGMVEKKTIGWKPTCKCDAGEPVPATVADIFGGAGTTAMVAISLGRQAIHIDLKEEYIEIAKERINNTQLKQQFDTLPTIG